jgi:hypothetical protein
MEPSELIELRKLLSLHRNEDVLIDGDLVPKSVSILLSMLNAETGSDNRYEIYRHILLECELSKKTSAAVKFARNQFREFGDVTALVSYSNALIEDGEIAEGLVRAKEALDMAIGNQTLINYAAGNYVREAVKARSVDAVNAALDALVLSTQVPRRGDCALEVDWIDEAAALGADAEVLSWIRSVAARK